MNAPVTATFARRRAVHVEYLAERYHRAFEEEAATLAQLLAHFGESSLSRSFAHLRARLRAHEALQEGRLFPAYEAFSPLDETLLRCWTDDNDELRACAAMVREAASTAPSIAMRRRVAHFVSEVERHLDDELDTLSSWVGAS